MAIPRHLHRVLVSGYDPGADSARWWERFAELHPGWETTTWTDPLHPDQFELGRLFDSCQNGAQLADLVRLEVLWRHGGVYVDADIEPLRSFDALLDHHCVLGTEDGDNITNAVIGAEAGHPALRAVMDRLLEYDELPADLKPNETTGPHLYTRVFEHRDDVLILPKPVFYPIGADEMAEPGRAVDRHALCIHHWARTWTPAAPESTPPSGRTARASAAMKSAARDKMLPGVRKVVTRVAEPASRSLHGTYVGGNRMLISTRDGFPMYAIADDQSLTPELVTEGWYDEPLRRFVDRVVRPGDWFVDVGANIGLFTIAAARRVGRWGRVIAYEADPELADIVRANAGINWLENVVVHASAAGSTTGTVDFARHPHFRGLSVAGSTDHDSRFVTTGFETSTVPVEPLDERIPAGAPVRVVKIDVEGGEADVLGGMTRLLEEQRVDYVSLEVIRANAGERWEPLVEALRSAEQKLGARFGRLRRNGSTAPLALDEIVRRERFSQVVIDFTGTG